MKRILFFLILLAPLFIFAQNSTVSGKLLDPATGTGVVNARVEFVQSDRTFSDSTDKDGKFSLSVPYGKYTVTALSNETSFILNNVEVKDSLTELGDIKFVSTDNSEDKNNQENIPTITLSDNDLKDESATSVSSALAASRDIFISTASYVMSAARFRIRGYDRDNFSTYINGIPVEDLEKGYTVWGQWGGLNNVFYNRETVLGLEPSNFSFGNTGGAYSFDSRASKQRKQLEISYTNTDRNYWHRLSFTYSTGVMKHGWAVSMSASRRWAAEGYVPGTFYDGYSYFFAIEKQFGSKNSLALTAVGAPTRNGRSAPATQEMYNLAGSNYYNPDWGWQNGLKRNANIGNSHEPLFILTHEWKMSSKENMITAVGFSFGKTSATALDWNNAADPHPDYYKYMPGYIQDSTLRALSENEFRNNESRRQINWGNLYEANAMSFETIDSADGAPGNTVSGKRARYIVENRIADNKRFNLASTYNNAISAHVSLTTGITYQFQRTENYKRVEDLLGADFYLDVNQFIVRDFPDSFNFAQNDLNHPNRILYEGDKWGYDYFINEHHATAWLQPMFKYKKVDFFLAAQFAYTGFQRDGMMKNGIFPDNSYGKSVMKNFINGAVKGGLTYKINERNHLFANAGYESRAPYVNDAFVSPRTRNELAPDLKSENIYSVEAGYNLRLPGVKLKLDMYFTQFNGETKTEHFFDDGLKTFVNYTLTGINKRHWGGEMGLDAKIYKGFSFTAVASVGRYTYVSRPTATITQDNSRQVYNPTQTIYAKNYNVGGTPQLALSGGLSYHSPQFWFVNVNLNYYDWMWLDFSPIRLTTVAIDLVDPTSQQWKDITTQTRLKGAVTMDIHAGYTWLLNNQFKDMQKKVYLVFNIGVTNVTNNKNFVTGGYEQLRYNVQNKDIFRFPPKLFYSYGATYFASITFRMN